MKFNFRPLSSFFKSANTEESKENEAEKKAGDDQNEAGDGADEAGEEPDGEAEEDESKEAKNGDKSMMISISQNQYKDFIRAEAELQKFGKTAEDRNDFLADARKLQVWYEAAASIGANSTADANAQEKNTKKQSKITADAKVAYDKAASKK